MKHLFQFRFSSFCFICFFPKKEELPHFAATLLFLSAGPDSVIPTIQGSGTPHIPVGVILDHLLLPHQVLKVPVQGFLLNLRDLLQLIDILEFMDIPERLLNLFQGSGTDTLRRFSENCRCTLIREIRSRALMGFKA